MTTAKTIQDEDKYSPPFFQEDTRFNREGFGHPVWDEDGRRFLDFTSGWGVTCLGHAHPVITDACWNRAERSYRVQTEG